MFLDLIQNTLDKLLHPVTTREAYEANVFWFMSGIITVCFTLYFLIHLNVVHDDDPLLRRLLWSLSFIILPFVAPIIYALFYTWIYSLPPHRILPRHDRSQEPPGWWD